MLKRIALLLLKAVLWFFIVTIAWVTLYKWVHPPFTYLMAQRQVEAWLDKGKENKVYYQWKSWDELSPNSVLAVMAAEDQNFLNHHGFDFEAIEKAIDYNKKHKLTKGASTISQQCAKNVFLFPQRNFVRKGLEAYFTVLIELIWGKKRIMEVYLNIVEQNQNRFGMQQSAIYAFNRQAKNLTPYQAAMLAAILPNPKRYSALHPGPYIQRRAAFIQQQMYFLGVDVKKSFE